MKAQRVDTWAVSIDDRPGALAAKLKALAAAGINLELVVARRAPDKPGTGVVFLAGALIRVAAWPSNGLAGLMIVTALAVRSDFPASSESADNGLDSSSARDFTDGYRREKTIPFDTQTIIFHSV